MYLSFHKEFSGDELILVNGQPAVFGNGSIHRYKGNPNVRLGSYIHVMSDDDKLNRLTFAFIKGVGFVYIRGFGKIKRNDGKEVVFPQ